MVDLTTTRTIDITKLALDGLMVRQKAITANTANVMTPGYQRKEVSFEDQLREIAKQEDVKTQIKEQNSIQYNPTTLDMTVQKQQNMGSLSQMENNLYKEYNPVVTDDFVSGSDAMGNNVDLEKEVMDMAAVGMRYSVLAGLEQKAIKEIATAIKGEVS